MPAYRAYAEQGINGRTVPGGIWVIRGGSGLRGVRAVHVNCDPNIIVTSYVAGPFARPDFYHFIALVEARMLGHRVPFSNLFRGLQKGTDP